jgi:single-stranded DNA-binding protein
MVVGKLRTRTWDKDGEKRYATDILVNEFHFCGSKQDKDTEHKHQANDYLPPMPNFDNDIPF